MPVSIGVHLDDNLMVVVLVGLAAVTVGAVIGALKGRRLALAAPMILIVGVALMVLPGEDADLGDFVSGTATIAISIWLASDAALRPSRRQALWVTDRDRSNRIITAVGVVGIVVVIVGSIINPRPTPIHAGAPPTSAAPIEPPTTSAPPTTPRAPTTAAATTSTLPLAPPGTWARIIDTGEVFGAVETPDWVSYVEMSSIVAYGDGFVAVGNALKTEGEIEAGAAVWRSPDGLSWTRLPYDPAVFGGEDNQVMSSVAEHGGQLVAVGWDGPYGGIRKAAVWTSPDGSAWQRVPHNDAFGGDHELKVMESIASSATGWAAVGWSGEGQTTATAWASPDGSEWIEAQVPTHPWSATADSAMESITAFGDGFVAVGWVSSATRAEDAAAVWLSPDGFTWTRVPHDEASLGGPGSQQMLDVMATDGRLVAVGFDTRNPQVTALTPAIWTSTDGSSWSRVPNDGAALGGTEAVMRSVAATQDWFFAVGDGDMSDAVVLTSPDAFTWTRVPHDPGIFGDSPTLGHANRSCIYESGVIGCYQYMTSVATNGETVVAVGYDTAYISTVAVVWYLSQDSTSPPPTPATTTPPPTTTAPPPPEPVGRIRPDLRALPPPSLDPNQTALGSGCVVGSKPLWDGPWFGYIEARTPDTIEFDLACFFTGSDAFTEAAVDGVVITGPHYIRNHNTRLKTLILHPDAVAFEPNMSGPYAILMSEWPSSTTFGCPGPDCGAWIYINDGIVTAIVEFRG